ncbi:MAG: DNA-binding protein [Myxococcota bacterium]
MIAVELPEAQGKRLRELAGKLGVSISEAAALILSDGLSALDPDFDSAAQRVFEKNAELYRRLS